MNNSEYWYPWYPTIFKSNTLHLTPEQDGLYRRLIDHYMESREPLPDNDHALARICGVDIECFKHASSILRAFFKQDGGLLKHDFCNRMLDDQDKRSHKRTLIAEKAAKKRWSQVAENKKQNASCMLDAMLGDATGQDKTIQNNKDIILPPSRGIPKPDDVSDEVWRDHLKNRKAKKQPISETALKAMRKEADKLGWTLEQALNESCARGWASFKAEWVGNNQNKTQATNPLKAAAKQRDQTEAMKILRGEI